MADYKLIRKPRYPFTDEFLEAFHDEKKGDDTKMKAWVAACDKVKSDFPKGD